MKKFIKLLFSPIVLVAGFVWLILVAPPLFIIFVLCELSNIEFLDPDDLETVGFGLWSFYTDL